MTTGTDVLPDNPLDSDAALTQTLIHSLLTVFLSHSNEIGT